MTLAIPRATRRSRFLFDLDPKYCLSQPEQALNAITGQTPTFTRAALTYAVDANGRYYCAPYGLPAFEWVDLDGDGIRETPGILLQGSRKQVVLQSDALATTWTAAGSAVPTNAAGTYAGRPFSRLSGCATASDYLTQTVTFTGDGVKAFSILAKQDAAYAGTFGFKIYDATASATVFAATLTVAAGGAVSAVAITGSLIATRVLADGSYRFDFQTASITAAHTNNIRLGNATNTVTSILLSGVQASDATFPAGLIPSTTGTVTTVADALSYTLNITPAQIDAWGGLTVYAQMARPVHADATGTFGFSPTAARLGANSPQLSLYANGSSARNLQAQINSTSAVTAATTLPAGSALAWIGQFKTLGSSPVCAVDVGSGLSAFTSAATAFAALNNQLLYVGGIATTGSELYGVLTRLKIAAGLQTLAYMGAG